MKTKATLLITAMFTTAITSAQTSKFKIGIGYQRTWMKDQQASPLKYQTSEKTFSLAYNHAGNNSIFGIQLNGALGDFFPTGFKNRQLYDPGYNADGSHKTDSLRLAGTLYNARIKINYLRKTSSGFSSFGKEKLYSNNYAGASLNNQLFYSDNFVRTGWINSSSLNAEYFHTALLNSKHQFTIGISIPLVAVNTRLPYHNTIGSSNGESDVKTFFKQGSRFTWLAAFQNIQLNAGYEYSVSNKLKLGLQYFGQWLHYNYEKPITLFQNNIGITASVH